MKLNRWSIGDVAGAAAAALLCVLVLMTVLAVALRYVAGSPLAWSEELSTLMILWIVMIGAVYAKRKDAMLRMDIFFNLMPPGLRRVLTILQEIIHCLLFGLMIYFGFKLALHAGAKTLPLLGVPVFWLYASLPVGACGLLLMSLFSLWDAVTGEKEASWD